jgi:hypothetical protein
MEKMEKTGIGLRSIILFWVWKISRVLSFLVFEVFEGFWLENRGGGSGI